jgi:hypothetical protein
MMMMMERMLCERKLTCCRSLFAPGATETMTYSDNKADHVAHA